MTDGEEEGLLTSGAEARERTRQEVHAVFAAIPEAPLRRCPHCGAELRTRHENCPTCGRSYFVAPPRFSRRTRRLLAMLCAAIGTAALIALLVVVSGLATSNKSANRASHAAAVAAERRRLAREQAPRHGRVSVGLLPGPRASPSLRREDRHRMVARLQALITADARARVARGELESDGVRAARCGPLNPAQGAPDEDALDRPLGRYACTAVSQSARNGLITSALGIPFVGVIDFRRGTLTWCKDNPVSPSDIESQLAFVRLARECTAARGPAAGSGYLIEPSKRPDGSRR